MGLTGFAYSLENYTKRLSIELPLNPRILDAGCGTGTLGIAMKKSFPKSTVLATDLEKKFFTEIYRYIKTNNFTKNEFNVGIANINSPERVLLPDTQTHVLLDPKTFDVVIIGAALGYSDRPELSILQLLKLVKPGGYLIDIEMSENIIGRTLSNLYKYRNPGIEKITEILEKNACIVRKIPFLWTELPAGLSRVGIVAQKKLTKC